MINKEYLLIGIIGILSIIFGIKAIKSKVFTYRAGNLGNLIRGVHYRGKYALAIGWFLVIAGILVLIWLLEQYFTGQIT